ncbi:Six-hairpin glycosidase [Penicillium cf. griseofulvum]|uniref:DNA polymerase delta subunit 3 n=1 Tax=Penicillium cf. griseofulvum TaxID=2972120 RepID=A0A9W9JRX3_9EURO|nr:Six-hairpin glycosidase [Penicillium cf. griseofulvum]KAJ5423409.1 Six-hairpin glycosidase [Penicillium cf. griseofulvum]KAJ5431323.1 Six-hairpin glycosidase [Penicillium cf. griseofulvum]
MDSKLYLAENVLNERRPVTYRLLSRALKVNANRAKHILFEFHRNENAKKSQTVHATYVISGIQKAPEPAPTNSHADDEDDIMDSPYLSSSMPNQDSASDSIRTTSIVLAREEDLEDAKSTFQSISTIHVYSLEPTALPDLNVLVDSNREIARTHGQEDPLECGKQWGMIQNRNVKRRTGARPPPPATTPAVKAPAAKPSKPTTESTVPAKRPLQKEASSSKEEAIKSDEAKSDLSSAVNSQTSSKPSGKAALAKQKGNGNLFSSFAKAKPKAKALAPAEPAAPSAEDVVLDDASEEEAEELFPDSTDKAAAATTRENRKEREERLKKMMDDDDDDEADDEEMPDADEEPREPTPVEHLPPSKPAELKEEVTVQGGRRRGKRQVLKKKTVKDEEGYLVTREEATWESFSEDEPVPKKKPAVNVPKAKAGKAAGQGNIMSFFGKK